MIFIPRFYLLNPLFVSSSFTRGISSFIAALASATIGILTTIFLEIDAESISICIIFAFGANSEILPVTLSLNLVPIENNTSHSLTALLAA